MNAIERHRQNWQGKSDEWLFERLDIELKQKVEEIHRLLAENETLRSQTCVVTADDNTYMQIINYGLQWGGKNPLGWKTGQDVVDYAKSKHQLFNVK